MDSRFTGRLYKPFDGYNLPFFTYVYFTFVLIIFLYSRGDILVTCLNLRLK